MTKLSNSVSRVRFINDLIFNISRENSFEDNKDIGHGLFLGDLLNNLIPNDSITGFSGIYVLFQANGKVFFKAIRAKSDGFENTLSSSYYVHTHGIQNAFKLAVEKRAEYCGYKGSLPIDKVTCPTAQEMLLYAIENQGTQLVFKNKIDKILKDNP